MILHGACGTVRNLGQGQGRAVIGLVRVIIRFIMGTSFKARQPPAVRLVILQEPPAATVDMAVTETICNITAGVVLILLIEHSAITVVGKPLQTAVGVPSAIHVMTMVVVVLMKLV